MLRRVALLALVVVAHSSAMAAPITYQYDLIARQSDGFVPGSPDGINNAGQVLFRATLPAGLQIVRSDGVAQVAIATSGAGSEFLGFSPIPTLNNRGEVAFAGRTSSNEAVYVSNGISTTALVDVSGPFSGFPGNRPVHLNDSGRVVFRGFLDPIPGVTTQTSINVLEGGVVSEVVNSGTSEFSSFGGPSINNGGDIAFRAVTDVGETAVVLASGGTFRIIADTSGPFELISEIISINNSSDIAFTVGLEGDAAAIYSTRGGVLAEIVSSTSTSFTSFSRPSINDAGDIAFAATDEDGVMSLNIFHGGVIKTILSTGDSLDGLLIVGLFLGFDFLNENGDIAFLALFEDGSRAIYRATAIDVSEIPAPGAFALFIFGFGGLAAARRLSRR